MSTQPEQVQDRSGHELAVAVAAAVAGVLQQGPSPSRLWTSADVAQYVGLSERVVVERLQHQPGFPRPVRPLGPRSHPRWLPHDVIEWARARRDS